MIQFRHTRRSVILFFLLTPLTLFIYPVVVLHHIGKEINRITEGREDVKKSMPFVGAFFLGIITLGIVPLVWLCRVSGKFGAEGYRLEIKKPHTSVASFLLLCYFFSFLIVTAIIGWTKFLHTVNAVECKLNEDSVAQATAEAEAEILETPEVPEEPSKEQAAEQDNFAAFASEKPESEPEAVEEPEEEEKPQEEEPAPFDYVTQVPVPEPEQDAPRSDIAAIYHVAAREDTRKWQVRMSDSPNAIRVFDSREEAIAFAKGLAARKHATVRVKK